MIPPQLASPTHGGVVRWFTDFQIRHFLRAVAQSKRDRRDFVTLLSAATLSLSRPLKLSATSQKTT
jgi:hypothetical protein